MPITLDEVDVALVRALAEDGRRSYRQLAKIVGVSTPTARQRIKRLMDIGFIRKIAPVFDLERVGKSASAIICLSVDAMRKEEIISYLSSLSEVRNVFLTAGETNIIIRATTPGITELQTFLDTKILSHAGVTVRESHIVIATVKDEQGVPLQTNIQIRVTCDYCGGEIQGTPFVFEVRGKTAYLCCKTCLTAYKAKHASNMSSKT
ncbi:MAG: AsnC family transcriptional regulator [Candidatus Caldarchaeum sp.]